MAGIETDHLQAIAAQPMHEPGHQRTRLIHDPEIATVLAQDLGQSFKRVNLPGT